MCNAVFIVSKDSSLKVVTKFSTIASFIYFLIEFMFCKDMDEFYLIINSYYYLACIKEILFGFIHFLILFG